MRTTLTIICENTQCANYGGIVNTMQVTGYDAGRIAEGYGYGTEDVTTDTCPECGILGELWQQ